MKINKIMLITIVLIMILNSMIPTTVLAVNEIEEKTTNNTINNEDKDNGNIEENDKNNSIENIEDEEGKQILDYINNSKNSEILTNERLEADLQNLDNKEQEIKTEDDKIVNEEFSISVDVSGYKINAYCSDDIQYLFLPQGVDITNVVINYTGNITSISNGTLDETNKNIIADFSENETMTIIVDNISYTVKVLQTDLPSISISLKGTTLSEINNGSKKTKYSGNSVTLKTPSTEKYDFSDTDVVIKGRGNYSWNIFPKKGYQLKLSKKVNVLGMGKAKKWLLIANYGDNSLMRNKLSYDLANEIGLNHEQNSQWIDLWIDGEYQGNYLLVEKVEVGNNRVELQDDSGVIVEMDNNYYEDEMNYFQSARSKSFFTLKDSVADDEDSINSQSVKAFKEFQSYLNEFELLLYSENKDWNKISSMIDVESFVKFYFIEEFTENADGARTSVYMYKDGKDDVLHMGPAWDFDLALANCNRDYWGGNPNFDYIMDIKKYMESSIDWYTQLFTIPEFRSEVERIYNSEIKEVLATSNTKINSYKTQLSNVSAKMNFIKWKTLGKSNAFGTYRGHKNKDTYEEEVQYLLNWIDKRVEYMEQRYGNNSSICKVRYISHIQDYGWNNSCYSFDGQMSGTSGESKRLEAIKISLDSFNVNVLNDANIKYQVHVQDYGWMNWKQNGEIAGTEGESKRIEAIKIKLENLAGYTVKYRVHVQDYGWMPWCYDGEIAGTTGESKRIEAIQIQIVKKPTIEVNYTYNESKNTVTAKITSDKKLSSINDSSWKLSEDKLNYTKEYSENDTYKVTVKDIDGIESELKVKITQVIEPISMVKYSSHVQNYGWEKRYSKIDGEVSGTTGQSKQIEAIKIALRKFGKNTRKCQYKISSTCARLWVDELETKWRNSRNRRSV